MGRTIERYERIAMRVALLRRSGLESRELSKALWLGGALMALTSSYTLVKTVRDALFLSRLSATWLPLVYILVGVVTLAVSVIVGRLTQRLSARQSLVGSILGATIGLALFSVAVGGSDRWVPAIFYLYVNAYGLIVVSQFWLYTNSKSDPREMKRIFGVVGGGAILGGVLGGVVASTLGEGVPLGWLVAAGAGLLVLSLPMLSAAMRPQDARRPDDDQPTPAAQVPGALGRMPYVRWLAVATLCSVMVTGLLDYQFKSVVQEAYPGAAQLTSFFGRFYIGINTIALLLQLIGTQWLLQKLGAGSAAAVLPIGLAIGAGATLAVPGFAIVLATRAWDQTFRFSLNKSAIELLFFPLPPGVKRRAKAVIEAGIERLGDAFAGILILGAGLFLDTTPSTLAALIFSLVGVWLIACARLRKGYVRELGRNLGRMTLQPEKERVSLRELGILKETVRMLDNPYERVVLQAIDLLEQNAASLLDPRIPRLLAHVSPRVRARALQYAASRPSLADRHRITEFVNDPDPVVRLIALRARCAMGGARPLIVLGEYLSSEHREIRGAALACLIEQVRDDELPSIRALIERMLSEGTSEDRTVVAAALGARATATALDQLLAPLLVDEDINVRCAAFRSAGDAKLLEHVPVLIRALAAPETQAAARAGLVALGDPVVERLSDALVDAHVPIEARRVIPRVLGDLPTQRVVAALFRVRDRGDIVLSYRILKAANRLRSANQDLVFPADLIEQDLDDDVREFLLAELHADSQAARADTERRTDDGGRAEQFLALVLRERTAQAFNRVFRRLGLLYPPRPMFSAYLATLSDSPRVRANAVEYIERALSPALRELVLPLLPGARRAERLELAEKRYGFGPMTARESLAALVESDDLWLRSCALFVVGSRRERDLSPQVEANLASTDARVSETAAWVKLALAAA
jgi:AAA family ATP:ADP antiporter